jgi:hypothetical protein
MSSKRKWDDPVEAAEKDAKVPKVEEGAVDVKPMDAAGTVLPRIPRILTSADDTTN